MCMADLAIARHQYWRPVYNSVSVAVNVMAVPTNPRRVALAVGSSTTGRPYPISLSQSGFGPALNVVQDQAIADIQIVSMIDIGRYPGIASTPLYVIGANFVDEIWECIQDGPLDSAVAATSVSLGLQRS